MMICAHTYWPTEARSNMISCFNFYTGVDFCSLDWFNHCVSFSKLAKNDAHTCS